MICLQNIELETRSQSHLKQFSHALTQKGTVLEPEIEPPGSQI